MIIIAHMLGICFFASLATSGFVATTQILYWLAISATIFVNTGNYFNSVDGIRRLKKNKPLPKEIEVLLPYIRYNDYDSKCVHILFSSIVHAVIALHILYAPVLAVFIMLSSACCIVTAQKFKEMMKHVENDPRYQ